MAEGQRTVAEGQRTKKEKIKGINIHGLVIFRSEEWTFKIKNNNRTCTQSYKMSET